MQYKKFEKQRRLRRAPTQATERQTYAIIIVMRTRIINFTEEWRNTFFRRLFVSSFAWSHLSAELFLIFHRSFLAANEQYYCNYKIKCDGISSQNGTSLDAVY